MYVRVFNCIVNKHAKGWQSVITACFDTLPYKEQVYDAVIVNHHRWL